MNYRLVNQNSTFYSSPFMSNDSLPKINLQIKNFTLSLNDINNLYNDMLDPLKRASLLNRTPQLLSPSNLSRNFFKRSNSTSLFQTLRSKQLLPPTKSTNFNSSVISEKSVWNSDKKERLIRFPKVKVNVIRGKMEMNETTNGIDNMKNYCRKIKTYIDNEKQRTKNLKYCWKKDEKIKINKFMKQEFGSNVGKRFCFFPSV